MKPSVVLPNSHEDLGVPLRVNDQIVCTVVFRYLTSVSEAKHGDELRKSSQIKEKLYMCCHPQIKRNDIELIKSIIRTKNFRRFGPKTQLRSHLLKSCVRT